MDRIRPKESHLNGWDWFEVNTASNEDHKTNDLALAYARCFAGGDGEIVLRHLRQSVLLRRLGPDASDAALRFLEGQRSITAHILTMVERGRG